MKFSLPQPILAFVSNCEVQRDRVGESPAKVYRLKKKNDLFFLKISRKIYSPTTFGVTREAQVLEWLQGRLNVPELVRHAANDRWECMITRSVPGRPLSAFKHDPALVVDAFESAIRCLQRVPVEGCAFDSLIARRLTELRYLLERGLAADDADLEPYPGIQSNADLLRHLSTTEMPEDVVFAHGDLGDSNLFLDDAGDLHFIDLGRGGLADRWVDIAFACRNLVEELSSEAAETLLKKLAIPDQPARRRYFEMLDELF